MKRQALLIISIVWIGLSCSLGQQILRGKISDFANREGVPYANISITQDEGTATDISGDFLLSFAPNVTKTKIRVSCIGYLSKTLSLDSLLAKGDINHKIYLTPASLFLQEVTVQKKSYRPLK
ncbi:MAG: carboxypeptidase-like regulatory domain-containing protein [Cytophagales bacterium]|nr:carboxypeptidase-like regulatory domain-containing protein [Cytophagales bacterium]